MASPNVERGWLARAFDPNADIAIRLREHAGGIPRISFGPTEAGHSVGASRTKNFDDRIKAPGGGLMIFQGMQDHTAESTKSLEGFDIASADEAQALSARSLQLLRPTIRKPGSEIWFSWNPRRESDAVDEFFRQKRHDDAIIIEANWRDNRWFPEVLEQERKRDLELYPG